ncbi:MAG TPA: carbohydrate ABC transporter permease [Clostridia bacterium]
MVEQNIIDSYDKKIKKSSIKAKRKISNAIAYIVLILGSFLMIYPFVWMLSASFSTKQYVLQTVFLPIEWDFTNYSKIISALGSPYGPGYWRSLLNTVLYSTLPVVICSIVSAMAAFAFAKIKFKGRDVMFMVLLAALMIPFPAIMMQQTYLYSKLDWLTGPWAMIVPKFFGNMMIIFFIRQYLLGMPDSLIESARIDGANYFKVFISIVMPLAMPAVIAQGLLNFMGTWNDYLGPLLFVQLRDWYPLTVSLAKYNAGIHAQHQIVMAGSVLALVPILIIFGLFQKMIIESVMLAGVKE